MRGKEILVTGKRRRNTHLHMESGENGRHGKWREWRQEMLIQREKKMLAYSWREEKCSLAC